MKNRDFKCLFPFVAGIVVLWASGCATLESPGRDEYHVQQNVLFRGDDPYVIQAIHIQGVLHGGATFEAMLPAMAQVAAVGGNVLSTDLHWSPETPFMTSGMMETVTTLADRARSQRMGIVVRLDVSALGDDVDVAEALLQAAAHLQSERRAVYWVDSENPQHAAIFKSAAPTLSVIATDGGDIRVLRDLEELEGSLPVLFLNKIPVPVGSTHFILADAPENYTALDQALMHEVEESPWTPDNTALSEEEREEGYIALFNGTNLDGWWIQGGEGGNWEVGADATIDCTGAGGGTLYTRDRFSDYTLKLEYNIVAGGNSGVFNRAPRAARQSWIGFEFQILGDYGEEPDDQSTGSIYSVVPPVVNASRPSGEWNEVVIELKGPYYRAWLNGVQVQDINFDEDEELMYRLREGFIGLQDHDNPVSFRNIRILRH